MKYEKREEKEKGTSHRCINLYRLRVRSTEKKGKQFSIWKLINYYKYSLFWILGVYSMEVIMETITVSLQEAFKDRIVIVAVENIGKSMNSSLLHPAMG